MQQNDDGMGDLSLIEPTKNYSLGLGKVPLSANVDQITDGIWTGRIVCRWFFARLLYVAQRIISLFGCFFFSALFRGIVTDEAAIGHCGHALYGTLYGESSDMRFAENLFHITSLFVCLFINNCILRNIAFVRCDGSKSISKEHLRWFGNFSMQA